jgi:XRE family aerobic/anaerobic benzoate catabolism transcriptional regulator
MVARLCNILHYELSQCSFSGTNSAGARARFERRGKMRMNLTDAASHEAAGKSSTGSSTQKPSLTTKRSNSEMRSRTASHARTARELRRDSDSGALRIVADCVRQTRARRGMTRKILARDSGVSERYLAQIEAGKGNISILVLRRLARALDVPLNVLMSDGTEPSAELVHTTEFLRRLPDEEIKQARLLLLQQFGGTALAARNQRIALIGMRGAGKSTIGRMLAESRKVPFVELDRLIEQESGLTLNLIFDFHGQAGFRRQERRCLEQVIEHRSSFVLATGGSLVSEPATFERLLSGCFTVWLQASPEEHMNRVIAQGDLRPMAHNREAMADLKGILEGRKHLYSRADLIVDTRGRTPQETFDLLLKGLGSGVTK